MSEYLDEQLAVDYLKGDEVALNLLVRRYLKPVYGFICHYVGQQNAEDITQEVFVRVWRHIKKFDCQRSFKTWIFSIAKNAAIDFLRKKKAVPFSEFENEAGENIFAEIVDQSPSPSQLAENNDLKLILASAVDNLPRKSRTVIQLRHHNQFTFYEMAEFLGESLNTVKSRYRRALIQLKDSIQL